MPPLRRSRVALLRAACGAGLLAAIASPALHAEPTPTPAPTPTPTAIPTPTAEPQPAPAPPPTPVPTVPPAPLTIELSSLGDLQVGALAKLKLLPAPFKASEPTRVRIDLTVPAAVGKRYGLRPKAGAKTVLLATKSGQSPKPIWMQFDLPLSATFRKRLKAKPTSFVMTMTATAGKATDTETIPVTKRAQRRR